MEQNLDLRIQKTYLSLKTAFASLMEEKRFEDITVNELCQRAMLRRTTFYKHFADKYEFFAFFIRELADSFRDQLPPDVMDGGAGEYFLQMSQELVRFSHLHEKMVQNIVRSSMFPLLLSILLEEITEDVAGEYFLQMSQELVRFSHLHEKMVQNIVRSSMFPLLLSILLEEITEDVTLVLRRACPVLLECPGKLKGMAAFYAGGMMSPWCSAGPAPFCWSARASSRAWPPFTPAEF